MPPKSERKEIVSFIELNFFKFEHLLDAAQRAIELMQEHRTALISAAVTGKIDVRSWVPPTSSITINKDVAA
jgi:type I restriction enzyme S subunit